MFLCIISSLLENFSLQSAVVDRFTFWEHERRHGVDKLDTLDWTGLVHTPANLPPGQNPPGHSTASLVPRVGRLESGPRLVGRIGSRVLVSAIFPNNFRPGSVQGIRQQKGGYDLGEGVILAYPTCIRRPPP